MLELRKFLAPEIIFGVNSITLTENYAENYEIQKALIVTDKGVINAGWTVKVTDEFIKNNIEFKVYDNVSPNPRDTEVMEGAKVFTQCDCDSIIAVGGGSPMDCAKAIGVIISNGGHITDYEGVDKIEHPIPPLICIPTTGGTSADVSQFSIILDTERKIKIAIISKTIVPDLSLIDPQTLTTMPSYLSACTGMDALSHAFEAYVSNASSILTDINAFEAIKKISQNLVSSIQNPSDLTYRNNVMAGSLLAGLAFSNASLGCVHAIAHSLGGLFDLPHGECNAMLLRHVAEYNYKSSCEKYDNILPAMGVEIKKSGSAEKKKKLFEKISELKLLSGIDATLKDKGISASDISIIAKNAIKDPCVATNPRKPDKRDIEVILEEAF